MGYFLVVDKKVLKYSNDFDKVLETMADMYGGRVSIDYYGLITKEEMLSMEYMDIHEGSYFFIAGLELIDWDTGARRDISINIYHSMYLMEYVDDEDEDGYAIIDWRTWLDLYDGMDISCVTSLSLYGFGASSSMGFILILFNFDKHNPQLFLIFILLWGLAITIFITEYILKGNTSSDRKELENIINSSSMSDEVETF